MLGQAQSPTEGCGRPVSLNVCQKTAVFTYCILRLANFFFLHKVQAGPGCVDAPRILRPWPVSYFYKSVLGGASSRTELRQSSVLRTFGAAQNALCEMQLQFGENFANILTAEHIQKQRLVRERFLAPPLADTEKFASKAAHAASELRIPRHSVKVFEK